MTWLSMRAKTDQQLMEINSQLNEALANVADIAAQVAQTRLQDVNDISSGLASLGRGIAELRLTVQQQGEVLESVIEGLNQMQSVTSRLQGSQP
jgi:ABC-type transporter Mla subunit MlaD